MTKADETRRQLSRSRYINDSESAWVTAPCNLRALKSGGLRGTWMPPLLFCARR